MLELGELSLFLTEDIYLIKDDVFTVKEQTVIPTQEEPEKEEEVELQIPDQVAPPKKEAISYCSVLFVVDVELVGLAHETFKNLVTKGLALGEDDFSLITQEQVSFAQPEEINSKKVILFGVPFSGYQTKYKLFHSQKQLVLVADSMEKIAANVDLKRQLWAKLQLMFPKPA